MTWLRASFFIGLIWLTLPIQAASLQTLTYPTATYQHLVIHGAIHVQLNANAPESKVTIHGSAKGIKSVTLTQKGDTLYLRAPSAFWRGNPITAVIQTQALLSLVHGGTGSLHAQGLKYMPWFDLYLKQGARVTLSDEIVPLRQVQIEGNASLTASKVRGVPMRLWVHDRGRVQLEGLVNFKHITLTDQAYLKALWVDSPKLTIKASDQATLALAGHVQVLDIHLNDQARFLGCYLRAKEAYAKSAGKAEGDLFITHRGYVFSSDQAKWFLIHQPRSLTEVAEGQSLILKIRGRHGGVKRC